MGVKKKKKKKRKILIYHANFSKEMQIQEHTSLAIFRHFFFSFFSFSSCSNATFSRANILAWEKSKLKREQESGVNGVSLKKVSLRSPPHPPLLLPRILILARRAGRRRDDRNIADVCVRKKGQHWAGCCSRSPINKMYSTFSFQQSNPGVLRFNPFFYSWFFFFMWAETSVVKSYYTNNYYINNF